MIDYLKIENFRGLSDIELHELQRVNLLTGKNNTGKTSILEAAFLFLGSHNPELTLRLNVFRGHEPIQPTAKDTWGWLFRDRIPDIEFKISCKYRGQPLAHTVGSLKRPDISIELNQDDAKQLSQTGRVSGNRPAVHQLELTHTSGHGSSFKTHAIQVGVDLRVNTKPQADFPNARFLPASYHNPKEDADLWSGLDNKDETESIITALKQLDSRIEDIGVFTSGDFKRLHANIGLKERIPVSFIGEGISRALTILLAIYDMRDGVLLIDEIENGIHYSILPSFWRAINEATRLSGCQVFATTHSLECLMAATKASTESIQPDFAAFRIEQKEHKQRAIRMSADELLAADEFNAEVR